MNKTILKIHRWLAIPFGIFISILCFTGAIILYGENTTLLRIAHRLHSSLFMPSHGIISGRFILGLSAIAMTLILITGIILWWPKTKAALKKRLSVHFNKGLKRFIYDTHISLGIYSVTFLLLMSLTGPSWAFKWYNKAATTTASVFVNNNNTESTYKKGHHRHRHGRSNEQRVLFRLHTGSWDGNAVKTIYFLSAIIGGFLPISGFYMWIEERKARNNSYKK